MPASFILIQHALFSLVGLRGLAIRLEKTFMDFWRAASSRITTKSHGCMNPTEGP